MTSGKFLLETNLDEVIQPADNVRYWESQEQAELAAIHHTKVVDVWVHLYKMVGAFRSWRKTYYKGAVLKCQILVSNS